MKENNYLAIGEFATTELLKNHINNCKRVIIKNKTLLNKFNNYKVKIIINPNYFKNNIKKEDIYVVSEFTPYKMNLNNKENHIVINDINDEGELGTILRTIVAFDYKNLALINSNIDIFSTKVIRASTGAIFMINIEKFNNKKEYLDKYKNTKTIEFNNKEFLSLEVGKKLYKLTQHQCENH